MDSGSPGAEGSAPGSDGEDEPCRDTESSAKKGGRPSEVRAREAPKPSGGETRSSAVAVAASEAEDEDLLVSA
eukprot:SAG11_NODE_24724_length_369_cov_0.625926_1_plen_72_part_10